MSKPRTVSGELPPGLLFQKGSSCLYALLTAPNGGPTKRVSTGIPYLTLTTDAERKAALERGTRLVSLIRDMTADEEFRPIVVALYERRMRVDDIMSVGFRSGAGELKRELDRQVAEQSDIDLLPYVERFARHELCLHPNKKAEPVRASSRAQQVSHVRRWLDWANERLRCGEEGAERPASLCDGALFDEYLTALRQQTRDDMQRLGKKVTRKTGVRVMRDAYGAMRQFHRYLVVYAKVTDVCDVTAGLPRPSCKSERPYWISRHNVILLIHELIALGHADAAVYCALLHGTALDTTDVARLTASQIERDARLWLVYSTSDKTDTRERCVMVHRFVHEFIGPHIKRRVAEDGPDALLFPNWAKWVNARDPYARAHAAARASLVAKKLSAFAGYEPRDSRHSLAVDMAQHGISARMIGEQLGTSEAMVASVYAKWLVTTREWLNVQERMECQTGAAGSDWETVAVQMDVRKSRESDASSTTRSASREARGTRQRANRRDAHRGALALI
jgi:site-specific recombinase XerD